MSQEEEEEEEQPTPNFNLQKGLTGLYLGRMNGWVSGRNVSRRYLEGVGKVSGRCLECG